jgi:tetratricopeptide (TPR) repeat protein
VLSGLALARRVGNRVWEWSFLAQTYPLLVLGEWDEVLDMTGSLSDEAVRQTRIAMTAFLGQVPIIHVNRGQPDEARATHGRFPEAVEGDDVQERAEYAVGSAAIALAEGRAADALSWATEAFEVRRQLGIGAQSPREAFIIAVEAALTLGERATAEGLLDFVEQLPRGRRPQYLEAHARRFRARLAAADGRHDEAEQRFKRAVGQFRELAAPFWLAVCQLEQGEWLAGQGRGEEAEPLLDEAREIFERLKARPWLERLEQVQPAGVTA